MRLRLSDLRRYRRHLAKELDNVSLYRGLADSAEGEHREVLLELAAAEERHARYWQDKLRDLGAAVPAPEDHRPGLTARSLSWLGRRIGVRRLVPLLERLEAGERSRYDDESEATSAMGPRRGSTPRWWPAWPRHGDPGQPRRSAPPSSA